MTADVLREKEFSAGVRKSRREAAGRLQSLPSDLFRVEISADDRAGCLRDAV